MLTAPTSQRALKKAGMVVGDIDLFESTRRSPRSC
jgi:hypothetical protein